MRGPVQAHVRKMATFATSLSGKPAREHATLQNLVHHIAIATPTTLRGILPTFLQTLDGAPSAALAVDVLAVLLTAATVRRDAALNRSILDGLLAAADGPDEALRKKITNTLPHLVTTCAHGQGRGKCEAALKTRVLDGDAGVRSAAVRAVGAVAAELPAADLGAWLTLLVLRLKDTSEDVRSMVRVERVCILEISMRRPPAVRCRATKKAPARRYAPRTRLVCSAFSALGCRR